MAERVSPWRSKPPQDVVDLLQQVGTVQLFLVQRPGPTSFVVREEGSEVKRKVQIGSRISCTCTPVGPSGTCRELCLHTLFVMVKVLRVPLSNPLLWQLSLSDRELEEVLRCAMQPERPPEAARPRPLADKTPAGQVKRREVDEEDPCPICYEDMVGQDLDNLVWCRFGCGRNVHGKCMGVWMEHQVQSLGKELTCPLCRSEWGDFKWRPPPPRRKAREERKDVHYGTHCGACKKAPLVGKRFRCLICADFDLCEPCFSGGHHPQHPFAVKDTPKSFGAPAERPAMMPTALPLARTIAVSAVNIAAGTAAAAGVGGGGGGPSSPRVHYPHPHAHLHPHGSHSRANLQDGTAGAGAATASPARRQERDSESGASDGRDSGGGRLAAGPGQPGDLMAVGMLVQQHLQQQQPQQQQQHVLPPRHSGVSISGRQQQVVRGTTVVRAGGAGRGPGPGPGEEGCAPPCLDGRLAARRVSRMLGGAALEGLVVGPVGGGGGPASGPHAPLGDVVDMMVRRPAPGQPSRPVVVRRARSTVHDRPPAEAAGSPGAELSLGLAGVQLNAGGGGGERGGPGEAGPGPGSLAAAATRQQVLSTILPRHPPRPPPGGGGAGPGRNAQGQASKQPHIAAVAWALPSAPSGPAAAAAAPPPPPPDLVLQGRLVLGGEGGGATTGNAGSGGGTAAPGTLGPMGRPHLILTHARTALVERAEKMSEPGVLGINMTGGVNNQPPQGPQGVRYRGPPPRYVPPADPQAAPQRPALRRSRSAGFQAQRDLNLAINARSMAPHPLTPQSPEEFPPEAGPAGGTVSPLRGGGPAAAAHASRRASGNLYGTGPYGPEPYGNEAYGGAIQYDDDSYLAFSHHIPGPGASFRESGAYAEGLQEAVRSRAASGAYPGTYDDPDPYGDPYYEEYDEFPRGPGSPQLRLFGSRPNTTPSGSVAADMVSEAREIRGSLSLSFTQSRDGARMSGAAALGSGGGGGNGSPDRACSRREPISPSCPDPDRSVAVSPTYAGGRGAGVSSGALAAPGLASAAIGKTWSSDVAIALGSRDSVLLASVKMDAVDDWMQSLHRSQRRRSKDGGEAEGINGLLRASTNSMALSGPISLAVAVPEPGPGAGRGPHSARVSAVFEAAASTVPGCYGTSDVAVAEAAGDGATEDVSVGLGKVLGESFEDTLGVFMSEQRRATQSHTPSAAVTTDGGFYTAYANPAFNRPYTLDMSFQ